MRPTLLLCFVPLAITSANGCTLKVDKSDDDAGTSAGGSGGSGGSSGASGTMTTGDGGGSGGAAGSGMVTSPEGGTDVESCGTPEATPNEDRDHASPIMVNTPIKACLQTENDVDFYEFMVPTSPAQGGVVQIRATDVGDTGALSITHYATTDNGEIGNNYSLTGASVFGWFAAKAGAKFRVKVERFASFRAATPYTLAFVYTGVNDANEPNDDNAHATPLTVGTPVTGYEFAGYEDSTAPNDSAWEDRYKVTLPASGTMRFVLGGLANGDTGINGSLTLYNALGQEVDSAYEGTKGASVVLDFAATPASAGEGIIVVKPFTLPSLQGDTSTLPAFVSRPYTLTATLM